MKYILISGPLPTQGASRYQAGALPQWTWALHAVRIACPAIEQPGMEHWNQVLLEVVVVTSSPAHIFQGVKAAMTWSVPSPPL